ncbi:threonine dehydratase [Solenopsis invicta]|uniref:threonine dehydratase n=1 Tax=Solenopsis invicta TaxID=13686 RepID=UPI00193E347E|nr:threonine dehydratase [Solenopsis invicta]
MSFLLEKEQENKNKKAAEESDLHMSFSYDIVRPLQRRLNTVDPPVKDQVNWNIIEKGSEKTRKEQRYKITAETIKSAQDVIRNDIRQTKCRRISILRDEGFTIFVKEECDQFLSSVKIRGVAYVLKNWQIQKKKYNGIIGISTSCFAFCLCSYAKEYEVPVTMVLPTQVPSELVRICRNVLSARVLVQGNDIVEAHKIALRIAKMEGLLYLDGNDHPDMIIGQATLGNEICGHIKHNIDTVILATKFNGCGLTMGIAMAIKLLNPGVRIIEVHPAVSDPLIDNIRSQTNSLNELDDIPVTEYAWQEEKSNLPINCIDTIVKVDESLISTAYYMLQHEGIIDNSGAIAIAAFLSGKLDELKGKRVMIPLFGEMDSSDELKRKYN